MSPLASAPPVAIVTALPEELSPILARAHEVERLDRRRYLGFLGGTRVVLAVTGDGSGRAERAAADLCRDFGPSALFGVGIAGALSASLGLFDLVAARRVRDAGGVAPDPDPELLSRARSLGDPAGALLLTVDRPIVDPRQKASLAAALALEEPAAADMESSGWARAASSAGVPYAILRAVADTASEPLPSYLSRSVGPEGGIRRGRVVAFALTRPATVPALLRMRRRLGHGAEKLAAFVERLVGEAA
jgi:adenosylhomocysteine nucleosidase